MCFHVVQMIDVERIPIDLFSTPMTIERSFSIGVVEHHPMLIGVVAAEPQSQGVIGTTDDHISMRVCDLGFRWLEVCCSLPAKTHVVRFTQKATFDVAAFLATTFD